MKLRMQIAGVVLGIVLSAAGTSALAQNSPGPGPKGFGYGGPPANEQERAARQAACPWGGQGACQGPCLGAGPGAGQGRGPGNGAGFQYRRGLRDGTGPRGGTGTNAVPGAGFRWGQRQ